MILVNRLTGNIRACVRKLETNMECQLAEFLASAKLEVYHQSLIEMGYDDWLIFSEYQRRIPSSYARIFLGQKKATGSERFLSLVSATYEKPSPEVFKVVFDLVSRDIVGRRTYPAYNKLRNPNTISLLNFLRAR